MTSSYNLDSNKYDSAKLAVIETIQRVADQHSLTIFIIGATARDITMTMLYGASAQRATQDVDFGICVNDWDDFKKLKKSLLEQGFTEGREVHRLLGSNLIPVDIVPYGNLSSNGVIEWPPAGDIQMTVLGFEEANRAALLINLSESGLNVRVASPEGVALLKLISWSERDATNRKKDATDISFLAMNYFRLPKTENRSYDDERILVRFNYVIPVIGAYLLGQDIVQLASEESIEVIKGILDRNYHDKGLERFKEEANPISASAQVPASDIENVLNALVSGLREGI